MDDCLVFNVGSSSLKWAVLGGDDGILAAGNETLPDSFASTLQSLVERVVGNAPGGSVIGHRIVHGGLKFQASVQVDAGVRAELQALATLDPLHMNPALAVLDAARRAAPDASHIAAFDTAFHRTLSAAASGYGLPHEWTERWGLRRFGFHGLSVEWSVLRASSFWPQLPKRIVVAHLGSGCSMTAVKDGKSIDTTMGFTPLDGLMMNTRSGAVDPGLLLYLQLECGMSAAALRNTLERESGLLGVSGVSADIRKVMEAADHEARARLAYDRFIVYGRRALGAMAGSLGGVDALIFTGGIGEHSARVRADLALALGEDLIDPQLNQAQSIGDGAVGLDAQEIGGGRNTSGTRVLVVGAREDRIIARDARRLARAARA